MRRYAMNYAEWCHRDQMRRKKAQLSTIARRFGAYRTDVKARG